MTFGGAHFQDASWSERVQPAIVTATIEALTGVFDGQERPLWETFSDAPQHADARRFSACAYRYVSQRKAGLAQQYNAYGEDLLRLTEELFVALQDPGLSFWKRLHERFQKIRTKHPRAVSAWDKAVSDKARAAIGKVAEQMFSELRFVLDASQISAQAGEAISANRVLHLSELERLIGDLHAWVSTQAGARAALAPIFAGDELALQGFKSGKLSPHIDWLWRFSERFMELCPPERHGNRTVGPFHRPGSKSGPNNPATAAKLLQELLSLQEIKPGTFVLLDEFDEALEHVDRGGFAERESRLQPRHSAEPEGLSPGSIDVHVEQLQKDYSPALVLALMLERADSEQARMVMMTVLDNWGTLAGLEKTLGRVLTEGPPPTDAEIRQLLTAEFGPEVNVAQLLRDHRDDFLTDFFALDLA